MAKAKRLAQQSEFILLKEQLELFRLIFDSIYNGAMVTDANGLVTHLNKPYARFLGLDADESIGKHCTEVVENSRMHIVARTGKPEINHTQSIHHASSRGIHSFVQINCAAIPKDLLESELFGYDRGAFTGARSAGKPGKFELAHRGTIFLDEIGDLPLDMQPKLLGKCSRTVQYAGPCPVHHEWGCDRTEGLTVTFTKDSGKARIR